MLTFYFTFSEIGGVPDLLYSIARIENEKGRAVKLIAKVESHIFKLFHNGAIKFTFIDVEKTKWIKNLDENDSLLLTYIDSNFFLEINRANTTIPNVKVLFWQVFPTSLLDSFTFNKHKTPFIKPLVGLISYYIGRYFINGLIKRNALVVMSKSHIEKFAEYNINIDGIRILPIPVSGPFENHYLNNSKHTPSNTLNISYIGRAEIWKIFPLQYLIKKIVELRKNQNITLHIFTDCVNLIKKDISKYLIDYGLDIIFYENFVGKEIENVLISKIDISFSMGTSLLLTAKLGIPSVFADASYSEIKENYRFRFLSETTGYNLGIIYKENIEYKGLEFKQIFNYFISSSDYRKYMSESCFSYVSTNHRLDNIYEKLSDAFRCSELTLSKLVDLYSIKLVQRVISMRISHFKKLIIKSK